MSVLKKVYEAQNGPDAHLLRGLLESEGIPAVVRGVGILPFIESGLFRMGNRPTVWVLDDARFPRALEIVHGFRLNPERAASAAGAAGAASDAVWTCPGCGERMERQFSDCWNCGDPRPAE